MNQSLADPSPPPVVANASPVGSNAILATGPAATSTGWSIAWTLRVSHS
jgi:hypothetical protein